MSKDYYEISIPVLLVAPIYVFFSWMAVTTTAKFFLRKDKYTHFHYFAVILVYALLIYLDTIWKILPYFPDTKIYSNIVTGNLALGTVDENKDIGFRFLSIIPSIMAFRSLFLYLPLNIAVNQIGFLLIWKAWTDYSNQTPTIQEQRFYLFLTAIYPLALIYSCVPLRESFVIVMFGLVSVGVVQRKLVNRWIILGTIGLLIIRRQMFLVMPLFFLCRYLISRNRFEVKRILVSLALTPLIILVLNILALKYLNIGITPNKIALIRYHHFEGHQSLMGVYPSVDWNTWSDLLTNAPILVLQFVLAPLPVYVKTNFWTSIYYLADSIFVLFLILFISVHPIRTLHRNKYWWSMFFAFVIPHALYEFLLSGAVRHRYPGVALLLPIASRMLTEGKEISLFRKYRTLITDTTKTKLV